MFGTNSNVDLNTLMSNPMFMAGLGLLSASRDRRIDPFQSAAQGLLSANAIQSQQADADLRRQQFGMQKAKYDAEMGAMQRSQEAQTAIRGLLDSGDQEGAAKVAIASGDQQWVNWGAGVLTPKQSQQAQFYRELQADPELMGVYQKMHPQNERSQYFQSDLLYGPDGAPFERVFNARTGQTELRPLSMGGAVPGGGPSPTPSPTAPQGGAPTLPPVPTSPIRLTPANKNPILSRENAAAEASGKTEGEASTKRDFNMSGVTGIMDQADAILAGDTKPTHSRIGTAYDAGASVFGRSPKGAAEADQMKVLGGYLVSKMPRMEGPQSNFDVQNYKEMAGDVGNSSLPIERRRAALNTLRGLVSKYDKAATTATDKPNRPPLSSFGK